MSKQKIREWLEENTGYFYDDNRITMDETIDIIHQYTKEQSGWVSVDEYSRLLADGELCWVLFPDNAVKLCRLNNYKQFGGIVDFWQDMGGDDRFMNATKFIKIPQPLPPTEDEV